MPQIDLDDLPPRIAQLLSALREQDELILVQNGGVVARLTLAEHTPPKPSETLDDLTDGERMGEVMSQFQAMIHDEF